MSSMSTADQQVWKKLLAAKNKVRLSSAMNDGELTKLRSEYELDADRGELPYYEQKSCHEFRYDPS